MYIDESGDHTYHKDMDDVHRRYLALMAVWFEYPDSYNEFAENMANVRWNIFGPDYDDPIIFHRNDIVAKSGAFRVLQDESIRIRFDTDLLGIIHAARFKMICAVIDKKSHKEKYPDPWHPYHYCLLAIVSRWIKWLDRHNGVGDMVVEARGKRPDRELQEAYSVIYNRGWGRGGAAGKQLTSNKIKIKGKKENIPGTQLADMLAYPVKMHYLSELNRLEAWIPGYSTQVLEVVESKFDRNPESGQIDGFGRVFIG